MEKVSYKAKTRRILCLAVLALLMAFVFAGCKPSEASQEKGLSDVQCENLYTLGKVWGVAKYYHPAFTTGAADWDAELMKLVPQVMAAKKTDEVNALLATWVKSLDDIAPNEPVETYQDKAEGTRRTTAEPNLGWLEDGSLSSELSAALVPLTQKPLQIGTGAPVIFTSNGVVSFENEKPYEYMNYEDDAMRFVALFWYWNVMEFYYPYKDILDDNWDDVLTKFIPCILEGDELAYKLTMCELIAHTHDSHGVVTDKKGVLDTNRSGKLAPFAFAIVEDKVVVTRLTEKYADSNPLQIGDVVLKLDGQDMEAVIQEKRKYLSVSRKDASLTSLARVLFGTANDSMKLTVLRDGQTLELDIACYEDGRPGNKMLPSHELLADNIGLINPLHLEEGELSSILETFKNTQGLIVDLRQYPLCDITELLSEYTMPHPATFANLSHADVQIPGRFYVTEPSPYLCGKENPNYYQGKMVLLINDESISSSEFTTMALRQAPNATVIGSPSVGADGNSRPVPLPGNLFTYFSSLAVYTPEGGQTQRIGLQPDIVCKPTIEGIAQGRDELMEKAIAHINGESN